MTTALGIFSVTKMALDWWKKFRPMPSLSVWISTCCTPAQHLNRLLFDAARFTAMNFYSICATQSNGNSGIANMLVTMLSEARGDKLKSFEKHLFSVWCESACAVLNRKTLSKKRENEGNFIIIINIVKHVCVFILFLIPFHSLSFITHTDRNQK